MSMMISKIEGNYKKFMLFKLLLNLKVHGVTSRVLFTFGGSSKPTKLLGGHPFKNYTICANQGIDILSQLKLKDNLLAS